MSTRSAPATPGTPWLEHVAEKTGPAQKTLLTKFPFSIGRNDAADLTIKSSRVSREHAAIVRAADTYRIRDLDSTNGTFLNGARIEEATLSDGDILLVADVEFTFFSGAAQAPRQTVTQVIGFRDSSSPQPKCFDLLRSLRRLQETLLHGGHAPSYRPIVELQAGRTMAVEAVACAWPSGHTQPEADRQVLAAQTRLANRLREMFYLVVAEDCLQHTGQKLFLPLECSEVDLSALELLLGRLATVLPDLSPVVFEVPDSEVNDVPYFHRWYARVRECGASLCYRDFTAGRARLEEHRQTPPHFIKLSTAMVIAGCQPPHGLRNLAAGLARAELPGDCRRHRQFRAGGAVPRAGMPVGTGERMPEATEFGWSLGQRLQRAFGA
jgi:EAL domain-containing protein (putative c-di-GMP-specific phosphodiesterase class I)